MTGVCHGCPPAGTVPLIQDADGKVGPVLAKGTKSV